MAIKSKAPIWAALIIGAAIFARWHGLSDGASFGIVAGLSGAAWVETFAQACRA
jgi:hypothetical protein